MISVTYYCPLTCHLNHLNKHPNIHFDLLALRESDSTQSGEVGSETKQNVKTLISSGRFRKNARLWFHAV
jgi:hypothetical protein